EPTELSVEPQKDLLGQVLGFVGVADVAVGEAVDAALKLMHELFEGISIPVSRPRRESLGAGFERTSRPGPKPELRAELLVVRSHALPPRVSSQAAMARLAPIVIGLARHSTPDVTSVTICVVCGRRGCGEG